MVGILLSYWDGLFSRAFAVSFRDFISMGKVTNSSPDSEITAPTKKNKTEKTITQITFIQPEKSTRKTTCLRPKAKCVCISIFIGSNPWLETFWDDPEKPNVYVYFSKGVTFRSFSPTKTNPLVFTTTNQHQPNQVTLQSHFADPSSPDRKRRDKPLWCFQGWWVFLGIRMEQLRSPRNAMKNPISVG